MKSSDNEDESVSTMTTTRKAGIPVPPSFQSAPDFAINIPSFSSAPDLSELDAKDDKETNHSRSHKEKTKQKKRHKRTSRSPSPLGKRTPSISPHHFVRTTTDLMMQQGENANDRLMIETDENDVLAHPGIADDDHVHDRQIVKGGDEKTKEGIGIHDRRIKSESSSPTQQHSIKLSSGILLVVDKYGDPDTLRYGQNHSYSVPGYKRSGAGRILGLSFQDRIDQSSMSTSAVITISRDKQKKHMRYTDREYTWKETDKAMKRMRIKPALSVQEGLSELNKGFISLEQEEPSQAAEHTSDNAILSSGLDYRSIEGNRPAQLTDTAEESDDEDGESFDEYVRRRTIEFNRQLDQDPHNASLWLQFVDFQEEAAMGLNTGIEAKSRKRATKASLNEVKMSILEKARDHNPDNEDLILAYLNCGGELWDTLTLLREWDAILKQHPESLRLWADYINLRQTNFASFSFTQCVKVYENCLSMLNKRALRLQNRRTKEDNYEARETIESVMVYVFLRACLFMKESGYHEKAFGSLQALIEFVLFQPQLYRISAEIPFRNMLTEFDEFWDSEVARFAEKGALGWHEYYRAKYNDEALPGFSPAEADPVDDGSDDIEVFDFQDWVKAEEQKEKLHRLPLRMSVAKPELVDEDPYLVTLSDDVRPFLFNITTEEARSSLIYSIFALFGLPYTPHGVGTNTHFCTDTFTHNSISTSDFWPSKEQSQRLLTYIHGVAMEPELQTDEKSPFNLPVSYPVDVTELFGRKEHWFRCLGQQLIDCDTDAEFVRNALEQLLKLEKSDELAMLYLSFASSGNYKSARKLAKQLLKDQRTNMTLWNAYAQMERYHGKIDEARKVYLTALSMTGSSSDPSEAPLIHAMFAQLEVENDRHNAALNILVAMADGETYNEGNSSLPTKPQVLKTKEFFAQRTAQFSTLVGTAKETKAGYYYIVCHGLFEYLTQGIDAACAVYDRALRYVRDRQAERGFVSEKLWKAYAELLCHHQMKSHGGYKPGLLRDAMTRALALFPNDTIFLGLFIWNEAKTKLHGRVRAFFGEALESSPNVMLWLSAIQSELHQYCPYDVNQVRSLFERAVEHASTRPSIILWKLYIEHEVRKGDLEKARSLLYRSVRECPWSKELYLLGLRLLGPTMSEKEIHEMTSLMMEKEIRLRCSLDEALFS
ncbi:NRDE-2, necessary for RNA interference-domain-containing protein [Radiomyces spectabilis]|uniref:NRDE-2, necessary for RNA interference-domain-containing protein n=1 Tax=Radiomyces spectabilis TaxID=64574 RepID=UPI002220645B|nr:NRDE-2, necessary for RNA interference-domain-containing protein [Radiomyces spectabilis]KAI8393343.1 NRDE-2, necessary for RNA interference-domain-containing protein [Radiomyces spectabilis]